MEVTINVTAYSSKESKEFQKHYEAVKFCIENELSFPVEGEIVKLYPETMQYGFWHEGQGCEKGKGHTYVNFENVVSVIA